MLHLAWRNTLRYGRRSLGAIAAIAFGIIALMLANGFIDWMLVNLREHVIHSRFGHIEISMRGFLREGTADPYRYLLDPAAPALAKLVSMPGVRLTAPRLYFSGLISAGDTTLSFTGEGVSPRVESELQSGLTIRAGRSLSVDEQSGVLIGQGLARSLKVQPGSKVVLLTTTRNGGINAVDATVRGTFTSVSKAYDDNVIKVPIQLAQRLMKVQGLHALVILLDRTEYTDATVKAMQPIADRAELEVIPWTARADFYEKTRLLFSKQMTVLRCIIGLIVVLSVSNTMIMNIFERTWEIGTMRALGQSRIRIVAQFLVEAILLGIVGAAVGVMLASVLSAAISWVGIPMPPPPGMSEGFVGHIQLTPVSTLQAALLALGTTVAAAAYPAWRAARIPIVDALRHHH
jgi:putative ABC transport system permease protein